MYEICMNLVGRRHFSNQPQVFPADGLTTFLTHLTAPPEPTDETLIRQIRKLRTTLKKNTSDILHKVKSDTHRLTVSLILNPSIDPTISVYMFDFHRPMRAIVDS